MPKDWCILGRVLDDFFEVESVQYGYFYDRFVCRSSNKYSLAQLIMHREFRFFLELESYSNQVASLR